LDLAAALAVPQEEPVRLQDLVQHPCDLWLHPSRARFQLPDERAAHEEQLAQLLLNEPFLLAGVPELGAQEGAR
jgi:hypothetical protein